MILDIRGTKVASFASENFFFTLHGEVSYTVLFSHLVYYRRPDKGGRNPTNFGVEAGISIRYSYTSLTVSSCMGSYCKLRRSSHLKCYEYHCVPLMAEFKCGKWDWPTDVKKDLLA